MEFAGAADMDGKPEGRAAGQTRIIIRQDDRGAAVLLEDGEDVLEESWLCCRCGSHLLVLARKRRGDGERFL